MTNVWGKVFIHIAFSLAMEPFRPDVIFLLEAVVGKPVGDVFLSLG